MSREKTETRQNREGKGVTPVYLKFWADLSGLTTAEEVDAGRLALSGPELHCGLVGSILEGHRGRCPG